MAQVRITLQDLQIGNTSAKLIVFEGQLDETNVDEEAKKIYQVVDALSNRNDLTGIV